MRLPFSILVPVLCFSVLGSACATTAKFDAKIRSWKGKDADTVVHWWGQPDATEKLSNGDRMYVYARLRHTPLAFSDTEGSSAAAEYRRTASATDVYLKCSSYFEIDAQGKVSSVYFRGEDCVSRD